MICGAEDLIGVCKEMIAPNPHQISADGKLSWEEVECLGACSNAPMAQIGKDYYEDLTAENFGAIIDKLRNGDVPTPGPQNGRWASEPVSGLTSLFGDPAHPANASLDIAAQLGDTIKRIDGTDPVPTWGPVKAAASRPVTAPEPEPANEPAEPQSQEAASVPETDAPSDENKPELLNAARDGAADDLKKIKGVGPKLEKLCNELGVMAFRPDRIVVRCRSSVGRLSSRGVQRTDRPRRLGRASQSLCGRGTGRRLKVNGRLNGVDCG